MRAVVVSLFALGACTQPEPSDPVIAVDDTDQEEEAVCGPSAELGLEVGQCALDFTLPDRYGQPFTLSSQRGKVALVDISAVW